MRATRPAAIGRVLVVGTGVIGTSAALALRRAGVRVGLADRDAAAAARAERMGAGTVLRPADPPADVVLIATPPSTVVGVLSEAQRRGLGAVYTDVASTKARVFAGAELTGCDLETYVPGHPIAGSELSGPAAARPDLFTGRPWVLCPYSATPPGAVRTVAELVALCGAEHTVLDPVTHDRVLAAVSHMPHLVSSALAARFHGADELMVSLVGRGLYDVTRIAAGPPGLWTDILEHNAAAVAGELESVARDLAAAAAALRGPGRDGSGALADLLARGNHGRERIVASWRTDRSRERLPV